MESIFFLNNWRVDTDALQLQDGEEVRRLEPKLMNLLCYLADRRGEVLSQEELREQIWPDTHVGESLLRRAVSELRRLLDDDARQPRFIKTIPKRGYQLIANVITLPEETYQPSFMEILEPQDQPAPDRFHQRLFPAVIFMGIAAFLWFGTRESNEPILIEASVTQWAGEERDLAASANAGTAVFIWHDGAWPQLYARNLPSLDPTTRSKINSLTHTEAEKWSPAFSPDGFRLAYMARRAGITHIQLSRSTGGTASWSNGSPNWESVWQTHHEVSSISWLDNHRLILSLKRAPSEAFMLWQLDLSQHKPGQAMAETGPHLTRLSEPPPQFWGDLMPRSSADGGLAFARFTSKSGADLYVKPKGEPHPKRLTFENKQIGGLDWSSDGRSLVVSIYQGGRYGLFQVETDSGRRQALEHEGSARNPRISDDKLLYEDCRITSAIYRAGIVWADEQQLVTSPNPFIWNNQWDTVPRYSPDGKSLCFVSTRAGGTEIYLVDNKGDQLRQFSSNGGLQTTNPAWSPDSNSLVYEVHSDEGVHLYQQFLDGGAPQQLTHQGNQNVMPQFSVDGAYIYFASDRDGSLQLWRTALDGTPPQRITHAGGYRGQEDFSGNTFYFNRFEEKGIWRQVGSAEPELFFTDPDMIWNNWCTSQKGVYFLKRTPEGSTALAFSAFGNGETTQLRTLPKRPEEMSLTVSPDGTYLLYAQVETKETDIKFIQLPPR